MKRKKRKDEIVNPTSNHAEYAGIMNPNSFPRSGFTPQLIRAITAENKKALLALFTEYLEIVNDGNRIQQSSTFCQKILD